MLIQIGQAIGVLPTIALLIADSILGAALMRSQGRAAWMRFNAALAEGRVPGREVIDGALVIFGGALLLTPGFLSDILGLSLLLPPTRAVIRGVLLKRFAGRVVAAAGSGARPAHVRLRRATARPAARGRRRHRRLERDRRRPAPRRAAMSVAAEQDRLHLPDAPDPAFRDAVTFAFGDLGLEALRPRARQPRLAGPQRAGRALCRRRAGRRRRGRRRPPRATLGRGTRSAPRACGPASSSRSRPGRSPTPVTTGAFDLRFEACSAPAVLDAEDPVAHAGGMQGYDQLCRVTGSVEPRRAHAPAALPGPARAAVGQAGLGSHRAVAQRVGVARTRTAR